jgi:hypothetical protein
MKRASPWLLAGSLALCGGEAAAQTQSETRSDAPATAPARDTGLHSRRSGTGRDQFIAPVMGIQIEGEGLNLPPGVEEEPIKPPAKPAAPSPAETKEPETRSTGK